MIVRSKIESRQQIVNVLSNLSKAVVQMPKQPSRYDIRKKICEEKKKN